MFTITKLSGDILITIKSSEKFNFDNISYDELKILFDTNINTGSTEQPYFMLSNKDKIVYTNLYDIPEMKNLKNIIITTTNINIIFLPYKKEDVDKIKNSKYGIFNNIYESNFSNEELKSDKLFVKMALYHSSDYYKFISDNLKEDKELIDIAISYQNLQYIPNKYKEDIEFMKYWINEPFYLIEHAGNTRLLHFVINCYKML